MVSKLGKLKVIPLGGLQEVGKNITAFEYENEIIVVDCGLSFPDDEMLGVDIVIPDITYLEKNKHKIKALVITHGHEDHIGAIPYFLKKINVPIYGTRLTLGLIETKLEEHRLLKQTKLKCVKPTDTVAFDKMKVEFIKTNHSIADSVAVAIHTPLGVIVHTSDFKVDYTPIDGVQMDFGRFAELGKQGVLLLLSDSTNAERKGFTMSERKVGEVLDKVFANTKKRIVVATFASNVHRMQQIINSAVKQDRKVAVVGRSMLNIISVASRLGYITMPEDTLIEIDKVGIYNPEQVVIITTGSQGEPMAALSRMAAGEHRKIHITSDDLVIFSSSPIPGNEKSVGKVIDDLQKLGAEVIYNELENVHVSGHACQEELKLMLSLVKPKYFMPVHGEYRFLRRHEELAKSVGMDPKNIFIMANGKTLELTEHHAKIGPQVPSGIVLVDGLGVGDVGNIVLRDRQLLSENGMIIVVLTLEAKTGKVLIGPDIITRGFVYVRESENLMDQIKDFAKNKIKECEEQGIKDWSTIKTNLRDSLSEYIYQKTKRQPMILPILMEI
ncbi:MAG: ribonuclease J [Clostridia bacterium]